MNSDELNKLLERRKHLTDWIDRNKKAQEMLPYVQRELELTELNIQALTELPDEAAEIPRGDLSFTLNHENQHLKMALPTMPLYSRQDLERSSDYIVSGSTSTMTTFISRVGEIGTENARRYADSYFIDYQRIQESQSRPAKVRKLIELLADEKITKRYDVAYEGYIGLKSGTANRTGTASEIRSLLHGVKLGLFNKARKWSDENMTWERMAHRLSKGDYEKRLLIQKEKIQSLLISDLSHIMKEQDKISPINLDQKWSQVLDHIYSIISLTKISATP